MAVKATFVGRPRSELLATAEEVRKSREPSLRRIFKFLGVDNSWSDPIFHREFHQTAERQVRRPIFQRASNLKFYRAIRRLTPWSLKKLVRPLVYGRLKDIRASIPEELRLRLTDILRDDVRRLYRYLDGSFDGWGIEGK